MQPFLSLKSLYIQRMIFPQKKQKGETKDMLRNARENVEKDVAMEIEKDLNWKERIVVRMFKKSFIKVYKLGITYGFNNKQS